MFDEVMTKNLVAYFFGPPCQLCACLSQWTCVNACVLMIQMKAELALQHINNRVVTVDMLSAKETDVTLESVWDTKHGYKSVVATKPSGYAIIVIILVIYHK